MGEFAEPLGPYLCSSLFKPYKYLAYEIPFGY